MGDKVPDALKDVAASVLNNETFTGETGDGVALYSTREPAQVSEAMLIAGEAAYWANRTHDEPEPNVRSMMHAIYEAMCHAAPELPDISEDAVQQATIEYYLDDATVEAYAIRVALGNNGGQWLKLPDGTEHYTPEQKEHWRQFIRDLAQDVRHAHKIRFIEDDCK